MKKNSVAIQLTRLLPADCVKQLTYYLRSLLLALQFWTHLPLPALANVDEQEWQCAVRHGVAAGLIIGLLLFCGAWLGTQLDDTFAAWLVLVLWCWVTGALHLDGVADLADALGAAHADEKRFAHVLKDPHLGSFGAIALFIVLSGKLLMLMLWLTHDLPLWGLLLIPAWSRWGSMLWASQLPPLFPGRGADYAKVISSLSLFGSGFFLFCFSWLLWPPLLLAMVVLAMSGCVLYWRIGGMSGDCLGAAIEWSELWMLILIFVAYSKFLG